jgi:hypothetical protein
LKDNVTSFSFFSICENAYQGMYPMPQLKMPIIFNMVFERSLTKGGIRTSSCLYVAPPSDPIPM